MRKMTPDEDSRGEPHLTVIGSGYVGTVVAAGFAHLRRQVLALEADDARLAALQSGRAPFYEADLDDLIEKGLASGRLRFTGSMAEAAAWSDIMFVCVGTPSLPEGGADLSALEAVAASLAPHLNRHHVLVVKSTVPIGTGRWLATLLEDLTATHGPDRPFSIVSNPEFLREGSAVEDFLHAERIVLGGDDPVSVDVAAQAYRPLLKQEFDGGRPGQRVPLVRTTLTAAEMAKYASNAFLAARISFVNEIANLCDLVGADVTEVAAVMGLDGRIGPQYLEAGIGWGGSCFRKDLHALVTTAGEYGYDPQILISVIEVNRRQRDLIVDRLTSCLGGLRGQRVGILGLAFKPGTDDCRDSPAVEIAGRLLARGAKVTAYDPMVSAVPHLPQMRLGSSPLAAAERADAVILTTEWPELVSLDLVALRDRMQGRLFVDGRNVFDPEKVAAAGLRYVGIGRPQSTRVLDPA